MQLSINNLFMK